MTTSTLVTGRVVRPWWACALVPVHLAVVASGLLVVAAVDHAELAYVAGLLLAVAGPPVAVVVAAVAVVLLATTRRSPWLGPFGDSVLAVVLGLLLAPVLLLGVALLT